MGKLFVQRKASPCLPPVAKVAKDEPEIKTRGRGWDLTVKCIGPALSAHKPRPGG